MAQPSQELSGTAKVAPADAAELARQPWARMLTSYAQNFEDVLLHRVFANVAQGFYVDIGAFSPITGSVTKIFYDRGWSGINIEPSSIFEALKQDRPRDINLNIAILDRDGTVDFLEDASDLGTSRVDNSTAPARASERSIRSVPCARLDSVLAAHAAGRLINFMKIDVEGAEDSIIRSTDWRKIRPQVLVIEAVAPWTNDLVSQNWEPVLLSAGYKRAYFDGLNLFFVAEEHADLLPHFDHPVNVLDWFERYDPLKDKVVAVLGAFNVLSVGLATRLDRVSSQMRGLPEERRPAPVDPAIPQLVGEFDAALTLVSRFPGGAQQFGQLLQKRHDALAFGLRAHSSGHEVERPDTEAASRMIKSLEVRLVPELLLRELDGAIDAAIRYERLVTSLQDPGGPRSLRLALPIARVIRKFASVALDTQEAPPAALPPHPSASIRTRLSAISASVRRAVLKVVRLLLAPIARRIRTFLLAPILPMVDKVDAMSRELEAARHVLHAVRAEAQISPQLAQSIEALLLTLAARSARK
jgi:FkbM family methyltransferase